MLYLTKSIKYDIVRKIFKIKTMKIKSGLQILSVMILFALLSYSCGNTQKPSIEEIREETRILVQTLKSEPGIHDVFGDSLNSQGYYIYTPNTHQLIPVYLVNVAGQHKPLEIYLSSLGLLGANGSDTVDIRVGFASTIFPVRQFRLKDINISSYVTN